MPFSNRSRLRAASENANRIVIRDTRARVASRAKAAVLSFALATVAGATVSQAQQQPVDSKNSGQSSQDAKNASACAPVNSNTLTVQLTADGQTRPVSIAAGSTVGDLLKQENITLDELDRCSSSPKATIKDGLHIWVARVAKKVTTEKTPIPFSTRQRYTSDVAVGKKTIATPGKNGERVVTYRDIIKDGKRTEHVKLSETVTSPTTQVEFVGVRGMTLASRGYFSGKRVVDMVATGYGPGENGRWGANTASGLRPGRGVVAVDPRFIPLGTRLYVDGYGYCVAGDTGGAIKGNRIDLGMDSHSEANQVGRKRVRVLILD